MNKNYLLLLLVSSSFITLQSSELNTARIERHDSRKNPATSNTGQLHHGSLAELQQQRIQGTRLSNASSAPAFNTRSPIRRRTTLTAAVTTAVKE
jgi:hypothetical protein